EAYVLGEIAAESLEANSSVPVDRKLGMGSTGILFEALKTGAIDVYADYTGTLAEAILKRPELKSEADIGKGLAPLGLVISAPLGFNNTYALAVKESFAESHHLKTIGDLRGIQDRVRCAFSYEFMDRKDGYAGVAERYQLKIPSAQVSRMEH